MYSFNKIPIKILVAILSKTDELNLTYMCVYVWGGGDAKDPE